MSIIGCIRNLNPRVWAISRGGAGAAMGLLERQLRRSFNWENSMNRLHMLSIVTAALLATACSGTAESGDDTSADALVEHAHQTPGDSSQRAGAMGARPGAHDLMCPPGLELLPPPPVGAGAPPAGAGKPPVEGEGEPGVGGGGEPPVGGEGQPPVGGAGEPPVGAAHPPAFPAIPLCCPAGGAPAGAPGGGPGGRAPGGARMGGLSPDMIDAHGASGAPGARPPTPVIPPGCVPALPAPGAGGPGAGGGPPLPPSPPPAGK